MKSIKDVANALKISVAYVRKLNKLLNIKTERVGVTENFKGQILYTDSEFRKIIDYWKQNHHQK